MKKQFRIACPVAFALIAALSLSACGKSPADSSATASMEAADSSETAAVPAHTLIISDDSTNMTQEEIDALWNELNESMRLGSLTFRVIATKKGATQNQPDNYGQPEFAYEDGLLEWNLRVLSSLPEEPVEATIGLFSDGIPIPFSHAGSQTEVYTAPISLTNSYTFGVSFLPQFVSNLGKVDVVAYPWPHDNRSTTSRTRPTHYYTDLPSDYRSAYVPILETTAYTVPIHEYITEPIADDDRFYTWLGDPRFFGSEADPAGIYFMDVANSENIQFEFLASPGDYRIAALLDFEPFPLFDGDAILDATLQPGEMLSFIGSAAAIPPGTHFVCFAVTKLDSENINDGTIISQRYEVTR